MRMTTKVETVSRSGSVIGDFRGMHQRNTKTLGRSGQSYQSVAREESMHIVKSGQDDVLVPSSENGGSVYQ